MEALEQKTYRFSEWPLLDPGKQAENEEIQRAVQAIAEHPLVATVLDSSNNEMIVLNKNLQIVVANHAMEKRLGITGSEVLIGRRLGEILRCVNASNGMEVCGSGETCSQCGASRIAREALESSVPKEGECLVVTGTEFGNKAYEYFIRATGVNLGGNGFAVVSLQDLSDRKRRRVLERVFIHDLSNTLTGLIGWSEALKEEPEENIEIAADKIQSLAKRMAREVDDHKTLLAVESNEYQVRLEIVSPRDIIRDVAAVFAHSEISAGKTLRQVEPMPDMQLETDPAILIRVLTNMVKNALEAEEKGANIEIGCTTTQSTCRFFVSNPTGMPEDVRGNVFKRSFSTKAAFGRGIGTYSMKLFGEHCLGGRVSFTSQAGKGTVFYIELRRLADQEGDRFPA